MLGLILGALNGAGENYTEQSKALAAERSKLAEESRAQAWTKELAQFKEQIDIAAEGRQNERADSVYSRTRGDALADRDAGYQREDSIFALNRQQKLEDQESARAYQEMIKAQEKSEAEKAAQAQFARQKELESYKSGLKKEENAAKPAKTGDGSSVPKDTIDSLVTLGNIKTDLEYVAGMIEQGKGTEAVGYFRGKVPISMLEMTGVAKEDDIKLRAILAKVTSMQIKELSGAAVSESEKVRLMSFLPGPDDTVAVIKEKSKQFQIEADKVIKAKMYGVYNQESGYKPFALPGYGTNTAQAGQQPGSPEASNSPAAVGQRPGVKDISKGNKPDPFVNDDKFREMYGASKQELAGKEVYDPVSGQFFVVDAN